MRKRHPSNTTDSAVNAFAAAARGLPRLPDHLHIPSEAEPFLRAILGARASGEWTGPSLVLAAELARTQALIESEGRALETEGTVLQARNGTAIGNPRFNVVDGLIKRELSLLRSLGLTGRAAGDPRGSAGARRAEREARAVLERLSQDDLLA